jgi:hypothetical protein
VLRVDREDHDAVGPCLPVDPVRVLGPRVLEDRVVQAGVGVRVRVLRGDVEGDDLEVDGCGAVVEVDRPQPLLERVRVIDHSLLIVDPDGGRRGRVRARSRQGSEHCQQHER